MFVIKLLNVKNFSLTFASIRKKTENDHNSHWSTYQEVPAKE